MITASPYTCAGTDVVTDRGVPHIPGLDMWQATQRSFTSGRSINGAQSCFLVGAAAPRRRG